MVCERCLRGCVDKVLIFCVNQMCMDRMCMDRMCVPANKLD